MNRCVYVYIVIVWFLSPGTADLWGICWVYNQNLQHQNPFQASLITQRPSLKSLSDSNFSHVRAASFSLNWNA